MSQDFNAGLSNQPPRQIADEDVVSIVHQNQTNEAEEKELFAIVDYSALTEREQESYFDHDREFILEKPIWEQLLTPWGISSLLLFLIANIILSWVQWSNPKPSADLALQSSLSTLEVPVKPQSQDEQNLTVDSLSVVKPPVNQKPVTPNATATIAKPPANVTNHSSNNLTNALLPPSLQPQFIQTTPIPVAQQPTQTQNLATIPINPPNQPLPAPPSVKPVNVESTQSNLTDSQREALLARERILEQIRQSEQQTQLGFNHQTRAKLQAAKTQQDPTQLVNQLEKLQQQRNNQ